MRAVSKQYNTTMSNRLRMSRLSIALALASLAAISNVSHIYCQAWVLPPTIRVRSPLSCSQLSVSSKPSGHKGKSETTDSEDETENEPKQSEKLQAEKTVTSSFIRSTTFRTSLVIVPPDSACDNLQKARHFVRDELYNRWPPCIRLFHPFCQIEAVKAVALDLALIVEDANLEPFDITLSRWTIIPHKEAMQADNRMAEMAAEIESMNAQSLLKMKEDSERREVEALIQREEMLGQESKAKRAKWNRRGRKKPAEEMSNDDEELPDTPTEQSELFEEFNGPCVLCVEPDKRSQALLRDLREFLRPLLFDTPDYYSPTSASSKYARKISPDDESIHPIFRPVVPIGSFSTVNHAVQVARKLKSLFGAPLSFPVTNFQIISCPESNSEITEYEAIINRQAGWQSHAKDKEDVLVSGEQFGCDAMVMLMGQEGDNDEVDEEEDVETIESLSEEGSDDVNPGYTDLERWLNDDEDFDEGSVVVIGRTHLFTGENRMFKSMPAASTGATDAKNRQRRNSVNGASRHMLASHENNGLLDENSSDSVEEPVVPVAPLKKSSKKPKRNSKDTISDWSLVEDDDSE